MGGKSRKSGGVSKALINRIVGNSRRGKHSGKSKSKKQRPNLGVLVNSETV